MRWPIHFVRFPDKGISEISMIDTFRYKLSLYLICAATLIMIVRACLILIRKFRKTADTVKCENNNLYYGLIIWFWASAYLWAFTTGYGRYYLLNVVLMPIIGLAALLYIVRLCQRIKKFEATRRLAEILVFPIVLVLIFGAAVDYGGVATGRTWSMQSSRDHIAHASYEQGLNLQSIPNDIPVLIFTDVCTHLYGTMIDEKMNNVELYSYTATYLNGDEVTYQLIRDKIDYYLANGVIYYLYVDRQAQSLGEYQNTYMNQLGLSIGDNLDVLFQNEAITVFLARMNEL